MDYMQIHETVVRDIMDAITDLKNVSDDINPVARARSRSSIMKSASDLVIVFPFTLSELLKRWKIHTNVLEQG